MGYFWRLILMNGFNLWEGKMKRYVELELEVKNIKVIDIITTSPTDIGQDTPGIGMDSDMLQ